MEDQNLSFSYPTRLELLKMNRIRWYLFYVLALTNFHTSIVSAQDMPEFYQDQWVPVGGLTSSRFAATPGAGLLTSAGLSWPDGRQAIITFWNVEGKTILRCIDYFDVSMVASGGICSQPKP
jgi:hypothetical protein